MNCLDLFYVVYATIHISVRKHIMLLLPRDVINCWENSIYYMKKLYLEF
jgi:hypothetical protein